MKMLVRIIERKSGLNFLEKVCSRWKGQRQRQRKEQRRRPQRRNRGKRKALRRIEKGSDCFPKCSERDRFAQDDVDRLLVANR